MKRGERGFTLIELLVVIASVALITAAATMSTFQVFNVTRRSNDHTVTIRQVQNAGYWISRDALMAQNIVVDDDPETAEFLMLSWIEWDKDKKKDKKKESIYQYYSVTYYFEEDVAGGIWKLKRQYLTYDNGGVEIGDQTTLVAEHIYYNPDDEYDPDNPSAIYNASALTVKITSSLGEASETREYRVLPRPDF